MKLRILYRGHFAGRWVPSYAIENAEAMFATTDPKRAAKENRRIERIEINHMTSKVLFEGDKPFSRLLRFCTDCRTPRQRTDMIIAIAERDGWDVVAFRDPEIGVAILNPKVIVEKGWITV